MVINVNLSMGKAVQPNIQAAELNCLAEELLAYLEASEQHPLFRHGAHAVTDVRQFDGAITLKDIGFAWGDDIHVMSDSEMRDPKNWLAWPLDATWCMRDESNGWPKGTWAFNRIRTCSPKEARGRAAIITPKMLARDICYITPDGARQGIRRFLSFSGGRWVPAYKGGQNWVWSGDAGNDTHKPTATPEGANHHAVVNLAFSVMLTRRYCWSVSLGFGGPSVRFLTDPVGVREIFSLRDLPDGRCRRAALRHWVHQHHRKRRNDDAAAIAVRQHLRGATAFTWNGLRCTIEPSGLDYERANSKVLARPSA